MLYQGWNFEKTLLIRSPYPRERKREFIDVGLAVASASAGNLSNDVRVVVKPAWNQIGEELPFQTYDIVNHGEVTTFRVAFEVDLPAKSTQRIGVLYDNPNALKPKYESPMVVGRSDDARVIDTPFFRMEIGVGNGQLRRLEKKSRVLEYAHRKNLMPDDAVSPGVVVTLAEPKRGGTVQQTTLSAANWSDDSTLETRSGSFFASFKRKGRLVSETGLQRDDFPIVETHYKVLANKPYFLVHTTLRFPRDVFVSGIQTGHLLVNSRAFSHYAFRPVTPSLPDTDVEEVGHILVENEFVKDLPEGNVFAGFLPHDLAWHGFVNTIKRPDFRFRHALTEIRLRSTSSCLDGTAAPSYRKATYLHRTNGALGCFRASVRIKKPHADNLVAIPAGTVYEETSVVLISDWDEDKASLRETDELGRRLNNPVAVTAHPRLLEGPVPQPKFELTPQGDLAENYLKSGVR